jgi:hypothetical protein
VVTVWMQSPTDRTYASFNRFGIRGLFFFSRLGLFRDPPGAPVTGYDMFCEKRKEARLEMNAVNVQSSECRPGAYYEAGRAVAACCLATWTSCRFLSGMRCATAIEQL